MSWLTGLTGLLGSAGKWAMANPATSGALLGAGIGQLAGGNTKSTLAGGALGGLAGYGAGQAGLFSSGAGQAATPDLSGQAGEYMGSALSPEQVSAVRSGSYVPNINVGGQNLGQSAFASQPFDAGASSWGDSIAQFGSKYKDTMDMVGKGLSTAGNLYSVYNQSKGADDEMDRRREYDAYTRQRADEADDLREQQANQANLAFSKSKLASYY